MEKLSDEISEKSTSEIERQTIADNCNDMRQHSDGDAFAWFQAVGAFFLMFNTWGLVNTYGVFQTQYQTKILPNTSASDISWIGSLQTFLLMFGTMIIGPLIDKGYLKPVLFTGMFLITFGMMMTSLCHEYWTTILAQGLLVGLGNLCLFPPSVTIVPQYFVRRRVLALGISAAGGSAGAIVYSVTLQHLEPKIGFAWSVRVIAFIVLGTLIVPLFGLKWRTDAPKKAPLKFDPTAWHDVSFNLATCAAFFGFLGMYIPFYYIQLYATSQHTVTIELNSYLLTLLNAGSLVGRIIPPYLADRIGPLNSIAICTVAAAILGFSWIVITTSGQLIAFCLLFGFFSGAFMALAAAVVAALTPNPKQMGLRLGFFLLPASIGVLIGNPIAGRLSAEGWLGLQIFCGVALSVSALCFVIARVWRTGVTTLRCKI